MVPTWDDRQIGETRLSSVQYLKFDTKGETPVAIGCRLTTPRLFGEVALSSATKDAFETTCRVVKGLNSLVVIHQVDSSSMGVLLSSQEE